MLRRIGLLAFLFGAGLSACGDAERDSPTGVQAGGSGGDGGAGGDGGEGGTGGSPLPDVRRLTPRLAGIVDPLAAAGVRGMLSRDKVGGDVMYPLQRFYDVFSDEFEYLVFMTQDDESFAWGNYTTVNRSGVPGIGSGVKWSHPESPSRKVLAAIAQRLGPDGPTIHEIAHHWVGWLSEDLGFDMFHWRYAGVHGRLGGFDPDSLFCETPAGTRPPCEPDSEGISSYVVDEFDLNSNKRIPYAPLELYLMGLVPPEEVPPVPILIDVVSNDGLPGFKRLIRARGMRTVTIDDIIAKHGLRPLATTEEERTFRVGFVLVTAEEPTDEQIEVGDNWVQEVSCQKPVTLTAYCFGDATRGLGIMKVDMPEP